MFKKIFSLVLVVSMCLAACIGLTACGGNDGDFKIGFICLHDETSTYDKNFIDAAENARVALGLDKSQVIFKKGIPETNACYEAAVDLVGMGCDVIFANSFGHESFMIKAAKAFPEVEFCHATGTMAHTENLPNFHNAFASIYEGRYLAGVAAGMKLNEMIAEGKITAEQAKIGYVGAFTYAEVISGYTSFFLGARSICPSATMEVQFTGSWYNAIFEKSAAQALINNGCVLISQHADSMGAPSLCEEKGVPNVSYNGSTQNNCPNTYIVSSRIDWQPYYELIIKAVQNGEKIPTDWTGTIATGSVKLTAVNENAAAEGTAAKIEEIKAKLENGTLNVFDTNTFTVNNGQKVAADHKADVDTDDKMTPDTVVVENGVFYESKYRSAPYFDLRIDGIKLLNQVYDPVEE